MIKIVWLYPTMSARSSHAFIGEGFNLEVEGDDVAKGKQSLCRQYGRMRGDHGWNPVHGGFPADACRQCARKAQKLADA